jgi:hypothetical protein
VMLRTVIGGLQIARPRIVTDGSESFADCAAALVSDQDAHQ